MLREIYQRLNLKLELESVDLVLGHECCAAVTREWTLILGGMLRRRMRRGRKKEEMQKRPVFSKRTPHHLTYTPNQSTLQKCQTSKIFVPKVSFAFHEILGIEIGSNTCSLFFGTWNLPIRTWNLEPTLVQVLE